MNKRYVTVEMSKDNKNILKLKAQESNLTIQEFVVGAIQNYKLQTNEICSTCNTAMIKKYTEHEMLFGKHYISIKNVPVDFCESCNVKQGNLYFDALLEDIVNKAFNQYLKENRKFPTEFEYTELTTYQ